MLSKAFHLLHSQQNAKPDNRRVCHFRCTQSTIILFQECIRSAKPEALHVQPVFHIGLNDILSSLLQLSFKESLNRV